MVVRAAAQDWFPQRNKKCFKTNHELFDSLGCIDSDDAARKKRAQAPRQLSKSQRRYANLANPKDPAAGVTMVAGIISQRANKIAKRATQFAMGVVERASKAPPKTLRDRIGTSKIAHVLARDTGRKIPILELHLERSSRPATAERRPRRQRVSKAPPEEQATGHPSVVADDALTSAPQTIPKPNWSAFEVSVLRSFFELRDVDTSCTLTIHELKQLLKDMGREPFEGTEDAALLDQLLRKSDHDGNGELDLDEFLNFIADFYQLVYSRIFNEHDADKSGSISKKELRAMLTDLQMAGFEAKWEDALSCLSKVDSDGDGMLDVAEFAMFMEHYRILEFQHLKKYSGFNHMQILNMQRLFDYVDTDCSGCLNIREVIALLDKTSYARSIEDQDDLDRFMDLFFRMDTDKSASLDFEEFLRLMRVWMAHEKKPKASDEAIDLAEAPDNQIANTRIGSSSSANALERERAASEDHVSNVSRKMDRIRKSKTVSLVGFDNGAELKHSNSYDNNLRVGMLQEHAENDMISKKFGLSVPEVQILRESFEYCDRDGSGYIDQSELEPLLEGIGCPPRTKVQKVCIAKCLAENGNDLSFTSVVKLISGYYEALAISIVELHGGSIPLKELSVALYEAGHYLPRAELQHLVRDLGLSLEKDVDAQIDAPMLSAALKSHRARRLDHWTKTCGFSTSQLEEFRNVCCKVAKVPRARFIHVALEDVLLVLDALGKKPRTEEEAGILEKAVMRVDRDDRGQISFEELLLLLRHIENYKARVRAVEEQEAAEQCGLSQEQVKELQVLFETRDHSRVGQISRGEVRELLTDLGVLKTSSQRMTLSELMHEMLGEEIHLDFASFLRILHSLENAIEIHNRLDAG